MCTQKVYTKCVLCTQNVCCHTADCQSELALVIRRNRSYCKAIELTALEKSKTPHHDMSKAHFIDLAIVEMNQLSIATFPFFAPPLNRLKLLTVVSVSFQSLTTTSLRGRERERLAPTSQTFFLGGPIPTNGLFCNGR